MITRGTESIVGFVNNAALPDSVHLRGSYSRAPLDGRAEDVTALGEFKDYYYPTNRMPDCSGTMTMQFTM